MKRIVFLPPITDKGRAMRKILFLILLAPFFVIAQTKDLKVGLVLSGGGAKGFAHVGVLKAIEKAGIRIDYIGGTSMGAIVGGLYAAGYSAEQIEKIILQTDFTTLLQDKLPRRAKPFFEKENGGKEALVLPVNNGKIGLPKGVSKGQSVLNFLTHLLSPVDNITNFSDLPTPFFCIATNVENGEEVILEKGMLPLALRASGSFPTLLHPVEIDGKLLVDGGIANNFPAKIMRSKGMDIIIGVDVQGKLFEKEKLNSVVEILNQIVSYQMYKKSDAQIDEVDVYVHPDIYEYSVVSFDKGKEILQKGEEVAFGKIKTLDSIAALQKVKPIRPSIQPKKEKFKLEEIEVNGNQNYTYRYVLGTLKLNIGDSISYKELTQRINNLTATNNFDRVDYTFSNVKSGKRLTVNLKESTQKASLKLGVHYDLLYRSAVLINYTQKKTFFKNDILSADFIIGDNLRYNLNYFVDNGFYWSFGFKSRYNAFKTDIAFNQNNISKLPIRYRDFTNQLYAQTTFDRKFALGFGVEHKSIFANSETFLTNGAPTVYDKSDYFNVFAFLKLDTYDDANFATRGFFADLGFKWYVASSDYNKNFVQFSQISGKLGFATTFWNKFTFQYESEAGFTLGKINATIFDFVLGGYNQNYINTFIPLYGYDIAGLADQSFLKSQFSFRYELFKNNYASFIANYARVGENVLKKGELFKDTKSGYALGYGVKTLVGPVELKYSWSPDTKAHFWLINVGFWF